MIRQMLSLFSKRRYMVRRAARWSCLVKPSSLGNFSTLFHNFGGAAEERFETKKYPKLPVVSARDGTEADAAGATPLPRRGI